MSSRAEVKSIIDTSLTKEHIKRNECDILSRNYTNYTEQIGIITCKYKASHFPSIVSLKCIIFSLHYLRLKMVPLAFESCTELYFYTNL